MYDVEKVVDKFVGEIRNTLKQHKVSYWTGIVGGVVILLNRVLGMNLNEVEIVSLSALLLGLVMSPHISSAQVAKSLASIAMDVTMNAESKPVSGTGNTPSVTLDSTGNAVSLATATANTAAK